MFFSANRARPGSQKLLLNGFTEQSFLRNEKKAYQNRDQILRGFIVLKYVSSDGQALKI